MISVILGDGGSSSGPSPLLNGLYFPKASYAKIDFDVELGDRGSFYVDISRVNDVHTRYLYVYLDDALKYTTTVGSSGFHSIVSVGTGSGVHHLTVCIYWGNYVANGWKLNEITGLYGASVLAVYFPKAYRAQLTFDFTAGMDTSLYMRLVRGSDRYTRYFSIKVDSTTVLAEGHVYATSWTSAKTFDLGDYTDGSGHKLTLQIRSGSYTVRGWKVNLLPDKSDGLTVTYAPEKIGVFFWASNAGTQDVINEYRNVLESEGYTKFFEFKDTSNFQNDFNKVADYEDAHDVVFFYLFGHGNNDGHHSYTAFAPHSSIVRSNEFRTMLDTLDSNKVGLVISSCHSGDWADDMRGGHYLAISSSDETHNSWAVTTIPGEERFANYFWNYVSKGDDAVTAYENAAADLPQSGYYVQNPKICDESYFWDFFA